MADTISVPVQDLEELLTVLATVHGSSQAHDIGVSYRKLSNNFQWSPMTKAIENQMQVIAGLIESAEEKEKEDEDAKG